MCLDARVSSTAVMISAFASDMPPKGFVSVGTDSNLSGAVLLPERNLTPKATK
jgi:hypothetical protein